MKQKVLVDVANRQKKRLLIRKIKEIAKTVLKEEERDSKISLVFVNDIEIAELNKRFRGKDMPTDVLAFPLSREEGREKRKERKSKTQNSSLLTPHSSLLYIGEVIISTDTAKRQAEEYGHSFVDEIIILTIHGILHILGYEHSKKMREKEGFYRNLFNTSLKFL